MPTCPNCFAKYPDGVPTCASDGAALVPDATFAHVDRDLPGGATVGEYTIESKLGEGGFGAVYSAVHPLIGKRAAVKILSREFSSNPQMVSRFIAEARAVNQIRHRNIIDIFSFGQLPDGRQYYIMELLEGMTFDGYLASRKRLDLAEALPILRGVARALDAAHAKGIIHRDLKPENIFLVRHDDGSYEPKLLDFGLVKLLEKAGGPGPSSGAGSGGHNTKTGTPMGTPYYMSPEQCRGLDDIDARTDVYSFGTMVFEVLTGELPFQGVSTLDILVKHMNEPPPSVSQRCPAVPASLDAPLSQIMAKDPNGRPGSVGEAVDFLARAAGMPEDSQRSFHIDSASMSVAERAVAPTVMLADPSPAVSSAPSASGPQVQSVPAQTFLGAETSIVPPKKSSVPLVIAAVLALMVGSAAVVGLMLKMRAPATGTRTPSSSVSEAPSALAEETTVDLRIDGVPEGTVVRDDTGTLGTGRGPFKVRRGHEIHLKLDADGYKTKELTVTPKEATLLAVSLEKAPAPIPSSSASAPATVKVAAPSPAPAPVPKPSKLHKDLESPF